MTITPLRLGRLTHEAEALRLSTVLLGAAIHCEVFTSRCAPIPGELEERMDWLRATLLPLMPASKAIATVVRLMEHERIHRNWDEPRWAKRELNRMRLQAVQMASAWSRTCP